MKYTDHYNLPLYDLDDAANLTDGYNVAIQRIDEILFDAGTVKLPITEDELADSAVTTPKIANNAVTYEKLADGSVRTAQIKNDAISEIKIVDGAISNSKIKDGTIEKTKLAFEVMDKTTLESKFDEVDSKVSGLQTKLDSVNFEIIHLEKTITIQTNNYAVTSFSLNEALTKGKVIGIAGFGCPSVSYVDTSAVRISGTNISITCRNGTSSPANNVIVFIDIVIVSGF